MDVLVCFSQGMLFFSPLLFGDSWAMAKFGVSMATFEESNGHLTPAVPIAGFLMMCIMLYVFTHLWEATGARNTMDAVRVVVWGHLAFSVLNWVSATAWHPSPNWALLGYDVLYAASRDLIATVLYTRLCQQGDFLPSSPRSRTQRGRSSSKRRRSASKSPRRRSE